MAADRRMTTALSALIVAGALARSVVAGDDFQWYSVGAPQGSAPNITVPFQLQGMTNDTVNIMVDAYVSGSSGPEAPSYPYTDPNDYTLTNSSIAPSPAGYEPVPNNTYVVFTGMGIKHDHTYVVGDVTKGKTNKQPTPTFAVTIGIPKITPTTDYWTVPLTLTNTANSPDDIRMTVHALYHDAGLAVNDGHRRTVPGFPRRVSRHPYHLGPSHLGPKADPQNPDSVTVPVLVDCSDLDDDGHYNVIFVVTAFDGKCATAVRNDCKLQPIAK
jgi:hypothetical protein